MNFAYLAKSHFAFKEVDWVKIAVMTALYAVFTWHIYGIMLIDASLQNGHISDPANLRDNGNALSNAAENYLIANANRSDIWTQRISLFGLGIIALLYIPIAKLFYKKQKA